MTNGGRSSFTACSAFGRALLDGIRLDQACLNDKALAANKNFIKTARQDLIQNASKEIALKKAAMAVTLTCRMVHDFLIQAKTAKQKTGEVRKCLFAQAALGTDRETVPNNQHAYQQFRIDRRTADQAVEWRQITPKSFEINEDVDVTSR